MPERKIRSDQWNPEEVLTREIIYRYEGGMSARRLGFWYSVSDVTITSLLKRYGVFIRNRSNAKRTNQIKEDVFDVITEESAYWIGFLLADGNVYHPNKRSKQLNLGLADRDWEHLEKFKHFIGSNKKLYYNKNGVFISIYSNRIVEKLAEYGIVPNKSRIAKVPESLKDNRHFWRGVIDGDGWVSKKQDGSIISGLCGTLDVVSDFKRFVDSKLWHISVFDVKIQNKSKYCWQVNYSGVYVIDMLKAIYPIDCTCLERKRMLIHGGV